MPNATKDYLGDGRRSPVHDRVSVLKASPVLPLEVAASLVGRVRWLRQEVERLDAEIGLTYPPIEVVPVCWIHRLADGTAGYVPARVNVCRRGDDHQFVVQVAAAALLTYDDDLLRGVLAHEFLHVVYDTLRICEFVQAGNQGRVLSLELPGYDRSWKFYRQRDRQRQVDGALWLSGRLLGLVEAVEEHPNDRLDAAVARINEHWIRKGLPVEAPRAAYQAPNILLDEAIIERATQESATKGGGLKNG
jgi:hypothetical protein